MKKFYLITCIVIGNLAVPHHIWGALTLPEVSSEIETIILYQNITEQSAARLVDLCQRFPQKINDVSDIICEHYLRSYSSFYEDNSHFLRNALLKLDKNAPKKLINASFRF